MDKNEIKKALYKEKPIARRVGVCENQAIDYEATTSLGIFEFRIPLEDRKKPDGSFTEFEETMPAQLLIRWLK
jgi:hypothetical protein